MKGSSEVKSVDAYEKLFQWILNKRGFYLSSRTDREDLMQELRIVYVKASRTYDATKDVSFETYLTKCCHNRIGQIWEARNPETHEVVFSLIEHKRLASADGEDVHNLLEKLLVETRFDVIDEATAHLDVEKIVDRFEGRNRLLLQRFAEGRTTTEVAKEFGVSKQAVSLRFRKLVRLIQERAEATRSCELALH